MKNLTNKQITIVRSDNTRVDLPPVMNVPQVVFSEPECLGFLGVMEFWSEPIKTVDFGDLVLNENDQPFIVSREVFDALPPDAVQFITPHPGDTTTSSFNNWSVVRRFLAKADAKKYIKPDLPAEAA